MGLNWKGGKAGKTEGAGRSDSTGPAPGAMSMRMSDETFERYQKLIYDECRIFLKEGKKPC
jgi:hypothetical protein